MKQIKMKMGISLAITTLALASTSALAQGVPAYHKVQLFVDSPITHSYWIGGEADPNYAWEQANVCQSIHFPTSRWSEINSKLKNGTWVTVNTFSDSNCRFQVNQVKVKVPNNDGKTFVWINASKTPK